MKNKKKQNKSNKMKNKQRRTEDKQEEEEELKKEQTKKKYQEQNKFKTNKTNGDMINKRRRRRRLIECNYCGLQNNARKIQLPKDLNKDAQTSVNYEIPLISFAMVDIINNLRTTFSLLSCVRKVCTMGRRNKNDTFSSSSSSKLRCAVIVRPCLLLLLLLLQQFSNVIVDNVSNIMFHMTPEK